ncbi:MAG: hypothetical protein KC731_24125 [Myxococcales bacterium]|nr:hypothetical protein [Myxococcales bacterium]
MSARRILAAALAVIAPASCLLADFTVSPTAEGGAGGTSTGGGAGEGGGGGGEICAHVTWPAAVPDAPDGDGIDFVTAMRWIDMGEASDMSQGPTIGYDLDGRCSCQGETDLCTPPSFARYPNLLCDGPSARDNNASRVFAEAATYFNTDISSTAFSTQLFEGDYGILVRVRDYNGEPNDRRVRVGFYPSPGIRRDPCNDPTALPAWDGEDRWPIDARALAAGVGSGGMGGSGGGASGGSGGSDCPVEPDPALDEPIYFDDNAYVAGYVLVASLPKSQLFLSRGRSITIIGGALTGRIESGLHGYELRDGLLVGRWSDDHVLADLAGLIGEDDAPVCTDAGIYNLVKAAVCKYMDIEGVVGGPTAPCDAISFGITFEAEPAKLGTVQLVEDTALKCPTSTDPAGDRCAY